MIARAVTGSNLTRRPVVESQLRPAEVTPDPSPRRGQTHAQAKVAGATRSTIDWGSAPPRYDSGSTVCQRIPPPAVG